MSDEILANLVADQCCPQCGYVNLIVDVDTAQNESQEVTIECDICAWRYKTTLKNLQDAGFCSTCSVDEQPVIDDVVIQLGDTVILLSNPA